MSILNNFTQKQLLINGMSYDWSSLTVVIGVQPIFGLSSINYIETQNVKPIYNGNIYPIGYGLGKMTTNVTMTIDLDEYNILFAGANEHTVMNVLPFDIVVTYINELENEPLVFIFKNCKITKVVSNSKQNDVNGNVTLTMIATGVNINGGKKILTPKKDISGTISKPYDVLTNYLLTNIK